MADDEAFVRDDLPRQTRLVAALRADPRVQRMSAEWHDMDRADREAAIHATVELVVDVYGIRNPPKVEFREIEGSNGRYNLATNTIIISTATRMWKRGHHFGNIRGAAVEEALHAYQWQLSQDRMSGRMTASDPLYRQAELFALNEYVYLSTPQDQPSYRNQPMQRHAGEARQLVRDNFPFYGL